MCTGTGGSAQCEPGPNIFVYRHGVGQHNVSLVLINIFVYRHGVGQHNVSLVLINISVYRHG